MLLDHLVDVDKNILTVSFSERQGPLKNGVLDMTTGSNSDVHVLKLFIVNLP